MGLRLVTSFDYSVLNRGLAKFESLSVEAAKKVPIKAAKGFTRRVVDITPPASKGRTGMAARRAGERRIDSDLRKIFAPVILRGKRPEQWPDVEGIYERLIKARATKGRRLRQLENPYYVDVVKLEALRTKLYGRVGYLAGGWNAAAALLEIDLPAWVRRHGTKHSAAKISVGPRGMIITLTNRVQYGGDVDGYPRRVQFALDYEGAALLREAKYLIDHSIEVSGLGK